MPGTLSTVVEPAVVVMLSGPLDGLANVDVQMIAAPDNNGSGIAPLGSSVHVCVAPTGNPDNVQVGAAAGLGPLLRQRPDTVTGCPATALAGTVVTALMSACGVMASGLASTLFVKLLSAVAALAVVAMLSGPVPGAAKVEEQRIAEPLGSGSGMAPVGSSVHETVAPIGNPVSAQVGPTAALGPAFKHRPDTVTD